MLLQTLKKRAAFLAAARALKHVQPEMLLQIRHHGDARLGVGYTASKKVGNAVARSRAKRRLRAIAREVLSDLGRPGCDYVLIARQSTLSCDFDRLRHAMISSCERLHAKIDRSGPNQNGLPVPNGHEQRPTEPQAGPGHLEAG